MRIFSTTRERMNFNLKSDTKMSQTANKTPRLLVDSVVVWVIRNGRLSGRRRHRLSSMLSLPICLCSILKHAMIDPIELELDGHGLCPEEIVIECLVAVNALLRIKCEQLVDQIERIHVLDVLAESLLHHALHVLSQVDLVVDVVGLHARPHLRTYRSTIGLNNLQLSLISVAFLW